MDPNGQAPPEYEDVAQLIDYTLLDLALTDDDIAAACRKAAEYAIRAVLVRPSDAEQALRWLDGSGVLVAGAVGFSDGSGSTGAKLWEGRDLLRRGAKEIDWVLNVPKHRSRQFQYVETEVMQIARSCIENGARLKIVLPAILDADLKVIATKIAKRVEAAFITVDSPADFALLQPVLRYRIEMKAAAVATLAELRAAQAAGCTRFGVTDPAPVLEEWKAEIAAAAAARS